MKIFKNKKRFWKIILIAFIVGVILGFVTEYFKIT
jgi:uncharacterized membrane-anchored protein YhcB (DUF1043 family)